MSKEMHQVCKQMRDLRMATGMSLAAAAAMSGVPSIVLGSYERGDRRPPLDKLEAILNQYGYTVAAVPRDFRAVQLPGDMAGSLRAIADQLERQQNMLKQKNNQNGAPFRDDMRMQTGTSLIPGL